MPSGALTKTCSISGSVASACCTAGRRVNRHVSPAGNLEPGICDRRRLTLRAALAVASSWLRNTVPAAKRLFSVKPELLAHSTQEGLGKLDQQTAAVARLAVGSNRTAMRQARQRLNGRLHDPMARQVVKIGDQAEAATVSMLFRVNQSCWPNTLSCGAAEIARKRSPSK